MRRRATSRVRASGTTEAGEAAIPYFAYWSIYTDLTRIPFRKLYWPQLKEIVGPTSRLLHRIEREENYWLRRPMRELRCHAYSFFRARRPADALGHVVKRASGLGALWQVLQASVDSGADSISEMLWDRHNANRPGFDHSPGTLPMLLDVMVSLRVDDGDWLGGGHTRLRKHAQTRPEPRPLIEIGAGLGSGQLEAMWQVETQTSTKKELLEEHWPRLRQTFTDPLAEMCNLQKRAGDIGPFRYQVRQTFDAPTAADVLAACLPHCRPSMHVRFGFAPDGTLSRLEGINARPDATNATRLLGLELRRIGSVAAG